MKYYILHNFGTSSLFKEKFAGHFKDLHKLKVLTNFYVSRTEKFPGGVMNNVLNVKFVTPPGDEVRLTSEFVRISL